MDISRQSHQLLGFKCKNLMSNRAVKLISGHYPEHPEAIFKSSFSKLLLYASNWNSSCSAGVNRWATEVVKVDI